MVITVAGFFGLFDYSKPGKGVDKGSPQKKSFVIFFEVFVRKFWKLIQVNLIFLVSCIPIVTFGLGVGGLTAVTRNFARQEHAFLFDDFKDTIKKNWKQLLPSSLINLLIFFIMAVAVSFYFSLEGIIGTIASALCIAILIIFVFMQYYIPMMVITFKLTIKQIYKNAFILAFAGLFKNLLITVILLLFWVAMALMFLLQGIFLLLAFFIVIFIGFAFSSYVVSFITYPVVRKYIIDPYYREHPEEEKPFHLAVEDGFGETEEDELIFEDKGREMSDFDK